MKVKRQKSSFNDNVLGRKVAGKNGFIVDSISTDSLLGVFYSVFYFVAFFGKYYDKCLPILYAYLNSCHKLKHSKSKPNDYLQIPDEPLCKVSALPVEAYRRKLNFLQAIFFPAFTAHVILI